MTNHAHRPLLPRRRIERLGWEVAALGLGGAWLGVVPGADPDRQDALAASVVHAAIDAGIDYLDTSPLYGESERRVGLALSQPHPEGGTWRTRVRLVSKAGTHPARRGDYSGDATRWSVENSLRALRTDHLDGVLVHDPPDIAPVLAPGGALEALVRLREERVLGAIGIGVHSHRCLLAAIADGRFDLIQTTYDYSLIRTTAAEAIVPAAAERGLGLINASPYHGGLLAVESEAALLEADRRRDWRTEPADLERARQLHRWAEAAGLDLRALALQFSFREARFAVTLVGPRDPAELRCSLAAAAADVPKEAWATLANLLPALPSPAPGGEATLE
jgi:aryl-alcohol dehydrogenase-like predicted oxidoreductase